MREKTDAGFLKIQQVLNGLYINPNTFYAGKTLIKNVDRKFKFALK